MNIASQYRPEPKIDRIEHTPPVGVKFHEYANLFPMMEGQAYRDLVEDIRQNGVREPIVFLGDAILDGRNRYVAAREAGVEYPRVEFTGDDPLSFVISHNLKRRHLTESQRAMVAAKLAKMPKGARTDLAPIGAMSDAGAAAALNVGERSVERAKVIQRDGTPELVQAVEAGKVTVSAAAVIAKQDQDTQRRLVAEDKLKRAAADLRKAKATGKDERSVRRDAERGEKVIPEVIDLIRGTKLDTGTYLDKLKKLTPNDQLTATKRDLAKIKADERSKSGISRRVRPAPLTDEQVAENQFQALLNLWNKTGELGRSRFLDHVNNPSDGSEVAEGPFPVTIQ